MGNSLISSKNETENEVKFQRVLSIRVSGKVKKRFEDEMADKAMSMTELLKHAIYCYFEIRKK